MTPSITPKNAVDAALLSKGLPFEKFLSTLDWAADAHPLTNDAESPDPVMCTACRRHATNSSDDFAGSADRFDGFAVFRVAREHRLAFSPTEPGQKAAWRFRAAVSVSDAKLRLALHMAENGGIRCLLVDTKKILKLPQLNMSSTMFRLELMLPFVSVCFELGDEKQKQQPGASGRNNGAIEMRLTAIRDAIADLVEEHSSRCSDGESGNAKSGAERFKSLYQVELEKARNRADWDLLHTSEGFSEFGMRCTELTMPPTFPHGPLQPEVDGLSLDQSNHVLFVDAFMRHEATRLESIKQAQGWIEKATKSKEVAEDRMLSKEEIEARRVGAELRHPP